MNRYFSFEEHESAGFTLIELMVASTISSIIMALLVASISLNQNAYYDDVIRTRINSNLRSALDIVSMNIRQAGEHLPNSFPAIVVENAVSPGLPDTLILRRGLLGEVQSLCQNASNGDTRIYISHGTAGTPECLPSNVSNSFTTWSNFRDGENIRLYVYDRVNEQGEWVDYTDEGTSSGNHWLDTSALANSYQAGQTAVYLLEEYSFELNAGDNTLELYQDGITDTPRAVAFEVSAFQVRLQMVDGSELVALDQTSTETWKDVKRVVVTLAGEETRKKRTFSSELTAGFFPRNVLSE